MKQQIDIVIALTAMVAVATIIFCARQATRAPAPDIVLLNGRIFTADAAAPRAEAIAIVDTRIAACGTSEDLRHLAGRSTRIIDLGGRTVIPGINDAHTHVGARPPGRVLAIKSDDPTWDEVIQSIRDAAAGGSESDWIYGTIGERVLADPAARRAALDRVAPHRRIKLAAWTGHGLLLSTAALRALDIGDREPDPPFGRYDRAADGTLNGLLEEYADIRANRRLTMLAGHTPVIAALRELANEAAGYGVTTIQAMANSVPASDLAAMLVESHTPIRWRVIRFPVSLDEKDDPGSLGPVPRQPSPLITVSGVKWILDGTPIERLAAMNQPYSDRAAWSGRLNFKPADLEHLLRLSLGTGDQVLLHVVGDRTVDILLETMEELAQRERWKALRPRIEHGDFVIGSRMARARSLGITVVQNPSHFMLPEIMTLRLGAERAAAMQPIKSLLAANVDLALGSDGPLNPFLNMMFAILHPGNPGEAMTREQVMHAYTMGSASAEFAERDKGSLTPGKLADLAVLSQDIFTVDPTMLPGTRAVLTIVNGRVIRDELTAAMQARPH
jgi:predicted amidohydrolase YtcJ